MFVRANPDQDRLRVLTWSLLKSCMTHCTDIRLAWAVALVLAAARAIGQDVPAVKIDTIQVTGHYDNGVGTTDAASAGVITPQLIDDRAILRPGEV